MAWDKQPTETSRKLEEIIYETCFASSTDYSEATDFMSHEVADLIGSAWMQYCGIPTLLRSLVRKVAYTERKVFFMAKGPLRNLGTVTDNKEVRTAILRRGVLMGDPMTKPVLHLLNICVRKTPESFLKGMSGLSVVNKT